MIKLIKVLSCVAILAIGINVKANENEKSNHETMQMQKTCPVMGGKINKKLSVDVKGKRIYVCCNGCIGMIKNSPEKYIKILEEKGENIEVIKEEMDHSKMKKGEKHH